MPEPASGITIRQLQIFLTALEHQSFVQAAEHLGMSPPAVSMQMSKLGEALGVKLFVKEGRSIRPTEAAHQLQPFAETIRATLHQAAEEISAQQEARDNSVRVAMVSTSRHFGPQLLRDFQSAWPDVKVEMQIANRQGVLDMLESRQVDLAIMGRTPRRFEVDAFAFAKHPYVLVSHPEHPLARSSRITRADLAPHRFLAREEGSGTRMVHDHFFADAGLDLPKAQEMDSNANIKQAVMADLGLAFLSAHTIALEHAAGKLCVLDAEGMPENREWYILHPRGIRLGRAALQFREFVRRKGPRFMQRFFAGTPFAL
ncbi:LysR family transcriptional regulator [Leisingera sp. ANG-Vp]|uniref:LysR family transcriptional regulator n=1 Tax=Leisingera sp. ANG-Vp TaxID=1577896 RepID=UPI000691FEEB|nr:LysR family transcriptional regulator [Leisingera sp. ANG-Vp]